MVLELSAPGVQDTGKAGESGTDETLVFGEALKSRRRGLEQGLVGESLMGTDKGPQGLRDGKSDEEVRSGKLCVEMVLKPLLGFMVLTLGAVAVATGVIDAVLSPAALTLIEAVSIVAALAVLDGTDDLSVGERQMGVALQVLWGEGLEDIAQGDHGRSPCMSALMRW